MSGKLAHPELLGARLKNRRGRMHFLRLFFMNLFIYFARFCLSIRYKVEVKGLDAVKDSHWKKPGGILFLPNHPALVDPIILTTLLWPKFRLRPIVVEYIYLTPFINTILKIFKAIVVPQIRLSGNSFKRWQNERMLSSIVEGLKQGDNFLFYPAGRQKRTPEERLGGASGAYTILKRTSHANVVLIRTTGLWGSTFSSAFTGKTPNFAKNFWRGIKVALKNGLFFVPQRRVLVEFKVEQRNLALYETRQDLNNYLENWYNDLDGKGLVKGEELRLVSYSFWKKELLKAPPPQILDDSEGERVAPEVKEKIVKEIATIAKVPVAQITPETHLSLDLSLDSLDISTLASFIVDNFDVESVVPEDLTTVKSAFKASLGKDRSFKPLEALDKKISSKWAAERERPSPFAIKGATIPEAFLSACQKMDGFLACGDDLAGVLSYRKIKLLVLLLAEHFRKLPGENIGIMLPSTVTANIMILATLFAGKLPVMINWTIGSRYLETVKKYTDLKVVLSSQRFLNRLNNVDFGGVIEEEILLLEDVAAELTLKDKLKAWLRVQYSDEKILKHFHLNKIKGNDFAVLLFTSGTESLPKGVPLSHHNILSNQSSALKLVEFNSQDVFLSILPPFHAFGFTVTCLLPILSGIKAVYYPDPTDGHGLVKEIERWHPTVFCGTPTFFKGVLKARQGRELKSVRLFVSGAEKMGEELLKEIKKISQDKWVIEGYGVTECSPMISMNAMEDPSKGVGKPLDNLEIAILDPESEERVPSGKSGEVLVCGPSVFSGYLGTERKSPFIFLEGKSWYRTGDLGYLDKENNLILAGRLKRFVKVGGEIVNLAALEETILQLLSQEKGIDISGTPVMAVVAKEKSGEKTRLFIVSSLELNLDEINAYLKKEGFSNLARISAIKRVETMPLGGTGKVSYRQLENLL